MVKSYSFFWLFSIFLVVEHSMYAQLHYPISEISETLKNNAKAIVRLDEKNLKISSIKKAEMSCKYVVTILNENGIEHSIFQQYYDKFTRISNINGIVYDQNGKKIKRIKLEDILDFSAISGYSIYEDNRVKFIDPKIRNYPFTIEYSYIINYDDLFHLDSWQPYNDYNIAIQKSSYKINMPEGFDLRFHEENLKEKIEISKLDDNAIYLWKVSNLPALKEEPYSLPLSKLTPNVIISPSKFIVDGYKGDASSWNSFGKWEWDLNINRDNLPVEIIEKIKDLVKDAKNDYEKIDIIYTYLQNKTRYVSIQLGIGGWQTIDAETVNKLGYGDCKALTNYMHAMLKVIGLNSFFTIVSAGKDSPAIDTNFPSNHFNHAFLCIPLEQEKDTLWLECTSQTVPCGYLGTFTDDRDALLTTANGGQLVHTKIYSGDDNLKSTKVFVNLNENGKGKVLVTCKYHGIYYDEVDPFLRSDDADKKKMIYNSIEIPDFILNSFNYSIERNRIPTVTETIDIELGNYGTMIGTNMFLMLNLLNRIESIPNKINDRISDISIRRSQTEVDTIIYNLPSNYTLVGMPDKMIVESQFGKYSSFTVSEQNRLIYIRYFRLNKGIYSKYDYSQFVDFFEKISITDQKKIALKKI
jgi:transglutaminase-like putative cysteine protease